MLQKADCDGSIKQATPPQELAEVLLLLANLWVNPLFNRQSSEEIARKTSVYAHIAKSLGVDIVGKGITEG